MPPRPDAPTQPVDRAGNDAPTGAAGPRRPALATDALAAAGLRVGATFDGFEVLGELGRGGMGAVLRARDVAAGRDVALKVVLALDAEHAARLRREGEVLARLDHPGVVRVHRAGERRGVPYLALELVEGARPLDQAARGLPPAARAALVRDAARALGHAHALGVVHRDVKAENLLVDAAGRVRVTDFGLAAAADLERLTRSGALLGTPLCMAPEQVDPRAGPLGPATDVWALGVVLYELLAGAPPFDASSLAVLLRQIVHGEPPPPPSTADPAVPAALDDVVLAALARDPRRRPRDGEALARLLDDALAGRAPGRARRRAVHGAAAAALLLGVAGVAAAGLAGREGPRADAGAVGGEAASGAPGPTPAAPASSAPAGAGAPLGDATPLDALAALEAAPLPSEGARARAAAAALLLADAELEASPALARRWAERAAAPDAGPWPRVALALALGRDDPAPELGALQPLERARARLLAWRTGVELRELDDVLRTATALVDAGEAVPAAHPLRGALGVRVQRTLCEVDDVLARLAGWRQNDAALAARLAALLERARALAPGSAAALALDVLGRWCPYEQDLREDAVAGAVRADPAWLARVLALPDRHRGARLAATGLALADAPVGEDGVDAVDGWWQHFERDAVAAGVLAADPRAPVPDAVVALGLSSPKLGLARQAVLTRADVLAVRAWTRRREPTAPALAAEARAAAERCARRHATSAAVIEARGWLLAGDAAAARRALAAWADAPGRSDAAATLVDCDLVLGGDARGRARAAVAADPTSIDALAAHCAAEAAGGDLGGARVALQAVRGLHDAGRRPFLPWRTPRELERLLAAVGDRGWSPAAAGRPWVDDP